MHWRNWNWISTLYQRRAIDRRFNSWALSLFIQSKKKNENEKLQPFSNPFMHHRVNSSDDDADIATTAATQPLECWASTSSAWWNFYVMKKIDISSSFHQQRNCIIAVKSFSFIVMNTMKCCWRSDENDEMMSEAISSISECRHHLHTKEQGSLSCAKKLN